MNTYTRPPLSLVALLAFATGPLFAQTAPAPSPTASPQEDEVVELSPFTVNATNDRGYAAENTLSGSRLNTALKDTPAVITVFTEEFISDLGVNDLNDLVRYDANTQPEAFDSQGAANSNTFNTSVPGQRDTYRSRGLPGSASRDFFNGFAAIDNYNISRVDFSKGPNGVLFGIGAIGGVLSTTTDRALLNKNATQLELQTGSWGLLRATVDTNQMVIPKKFALRFNLLKQEEGGYRYYTFNDKERATISATLQPLKNTVLRANWEFGTDKKSNHRPFGPADGVSEWLAQGKLPVAYTGGRAVAQATNGIGVRNNTPYLVFVEGVGAYNEARGGTTTAFNDQKTDTPFRVNYAGRRLYDDPAQFGELAVSNRVASGGNDEFSRNKTDNYLITLEQKLTDDLIMEVDYFHDRLRTYGQSPGGVQLQADPNPLIGNANGTLDQPFNNPFGANPNAGRYYFDSNWQRERGDREQKAVRATVAYELDLGKKLSGNLSRIFGRQRFAFGGERNRQEIDRAFEVEVFDYAFLSQVNALGFQRLVPTAPENAANTVNRRNYVTFGDWKNFNTGRFPTSNTLNLTQVPGNSAGVTFVPNNVNNISNDIIDGDVYLGALQSYFFKDRLVTTFGYRKDKIQVAHARSVRDAPATTGGPVDIDRDGMQNEFVLLRDQREITDVNAVSRSLGGVFHLNKSKTLSVFYNTSSGTALPPVNQQVPPKGEIAPGQSGKTNDYGIIFSLFDDRLSGRISSYDTTEENRFFFQLAGANGMATNVLDALQPLLASTSQAISQAERDAHTPNFNGSTGDGSSKGYEVQLRYNPTPAITINFAYSKTERTLTNIMTDLQSYVDNEAAYYTQKLAVVGQTTTTVNSARAIIPPETIQQEIDRVNNSIILFRTQREFGFGEAPHKVVMTGKYSFLEGRLKGLALGGSTQWLSPTEIAPKIRFNDANGNFNIDTGELILDANGKPIKDGSFKGNINFNVDAFATYKFSARLFSHKLNLEAQLNVRNVLDETDVIKQSNNAANTGLNQFTFREPRSFRFTLRTKF